MLETAAAPRRLLTAVQDVELGTLGTAVTGAAVLCPASHWLLSPHTSPVSLLIGQSGESFAPRLNVFLCRGSNKRRLGGAAGVPLLPGAAAVPCVLARQGGADVANTVTLIPTTSSSNRTY